MDIKQYKIKDLTPYNNNPRANDQAVDAVAESIKQFGFKVPIVIDKDNVIITGHTRLKAATKLGLKTVPVILADDLTPDQVKAFRLADNKTGELAGWDFEKLEVELSELEMDMEGFGFEIEEKEIEGLTDDDEVPEDVNPVCQLGQIWKLGEHRVMCGDSTKAEDVAKLMDGEKADMVFTDPPYSVNYEIKQKEVLGKKGYNHISGDNLSVDNISEQIWKPVFKNLYDIAKDDCSFYVTMPQGGDQMMMMMMMMMGEKWQIKHELIWIKKSPVFSMGRLDYDYQHEPIMYGWKKSHHFYGAGKYVKSIWEIDRDSDGSHPTMKPVELIENAILNSSIKDMVVADYFLGSGSTLIAAEKTNRRCYGMEIDPHYCDVIIKRWEDFTGNKSELIK